MFSDLVALGQQWEGSEGFPHPGFYAYAKTSPIRWIVNYWPDRVYLEASSSDADRPFSGRTSGQEAHFLVDEAAYALGVATQKDGAADKHAAKKHTLFLDLLRAYLDDPDRDAELADSVGLLLRLLESGTILDDPRYGDIESKHWVAFVPQTGPLAGASIFALPDARRFWIAEMERRCASHESGDDSPVIDGTCSVCGRTPVKLVGKLPLKVKLIKTAPIHSLNQSAFTSFIAGAGTTDRAHLGICFECGDTAARAFNFLSNSLQHRKPLYPSERTADGLSNSVALFWLKGPGPLVVESPELEEMVYDLNTALDIGLTAIAATRAAPATLGQLRRLLDVPWRPLPDGCDLGEYAFYVAIVSPNVGRVAVRDWFSVTIRELIDHLRRYLDLTRTIEANGRGESSAAAATIAEACGTHDTNLLRSLLRTAYTGTPPPEALVVLAGQRLNHLLPLERDLRDRQLSLSFDKKPVWGPRWSHALAAAIRLGLRFGKEDPTLATAELERDIGYQCGRLLALLEEAQQVYTWRQYGHRLDVSLVQRAYGGASTTPATVFNRLMRQANMAHLPKSTRSIREEVGRVSQRIAEIGKIPDALNPIEQAQFGLGYYTQRAEIRSWSQTERAPDEPDVPDSSDDVTTDEEETK